MLQHLWKWWNQVGDYWVFDLSLLPVNYENNILNFTETKNNEKYFIHILCLWQCFEKTENWLFALFYLCLFTPQRKKNSSLKSKIVFRYVSDFFFLQSIILKSIKHQVVLPSYHRKCDTFAWSHKINLIIFY